MLIFYFFWMLFHFMIVSNGDFAMQRKGVLKMVCSGITCVRCAPAQGISQCFMMGLADALLSQKLALETPVLFVGGERPGQHPPLCPDAAPSPCFWPQPTPFILSSLEAEHSSRFLTPLLGATALVVICIAVLAAVALARKVTTQAAQLSPEHLAPGALILSHPLSV